MFDVSALIV